MTVYRWDGRETISSKSDKLIRGAIYQVYDLDEDDYTISLLTSTAEYWHPIDDFTELNLIEDEY